jgi:YVTN family beta-propeller protein
MTEMPTADAPAPQPGSSASPITIDVIETPHSIAVSNDGSRVYVSHFQSGSISLIDAGTESVTAVLASSPGAYGVAPTFNDEFLHVAHPDSDFLQTLQVKSGDKVADGIGAKAYGLVTVKGGRLYATAALDNTILVLDVMLVDVLDNLVRNVAKIDGVKFPVAIVASPDGSSLYVSNYFSATVSVIDATQVSIGVFDQPAVVVHTIPVAIGPYGLAVSPDGSRLFVAHFPQGDAISVVDTTSFSVIDQISVGNGPVRGLAVSRDGAKLYAANYFASSVSVLGI